MNLKATAATVALVGGMTVGSLAGNAASPATATENNIVICHNGFELHFSPHPSQAKNIAAHLKHGDRLGYCSTPTSTPTATATPTVSPTATATSSPTATPAPSVTATPTPSATPPLEPISSTDTDDPCVNHPHLNQHNQPRIIRDGVWLQDTDCGQYFKEPVVTSTPVATPAVGLPVQPEGNVELLPPVIDYSPPMPMPEGPIFLPKAGTGPENSSSDFVVPFALLGMVLSSGFIGWFIRGFK